MNSVGIVWHQKGLKLLNDLFSKKGNRTPAAPTAAPEKPPPLVYVALPRKSRIKAAHAVSFLFAPSGNVYTQLPQPRPAYAHAPATKKWGKTIWQLLPIAVLIATIFASIGMLRILVEGVQFAEYYPAGYIKTQSWRGGAGPAPQDAVKTEYQNALTREMVSAMDTSATKVAAPAKKKKAKTDARIQVTASKYQSSVKKGLHNLKLKVVNGTPNTLDKVVVAVDFFGKKGKLLQTELYATPPVGPHQERVITIPEGTPGIKVAYRIHEVRSRKHVTQLYSL
ncbi:hypothetical protein [Pseudocnuella soli]|uniref:hypothetical protein n=1 Tax=Pseudocnuella soli TaxID=2502779 RepID=UPI0010461C31|nr:hypothetical protein [Pseudocnuella soli]